MKYVLVTGASGFIGANLVCALLKQKIRVLAFDVLEEQRDRHEIKSLLNGISIQDFRNCLNFVDSNCLAVFHMGAISDTRCSDVNLLQERNIRFSKLLATRCRDQNIAFLYASSAATYGDGSSGYSDDEKHISELKPLNLYGHSKHEVDLWMLKNHSCRTEGKKNWAGFKFFNVYGYGEAHKGEMASVVYKAYNQIQTQGFVKLFKSYRTDFEHGEQKRDFVFVDDVVVTLLDAWKKNITSGIYNIGSGRARSFNELVGTCFKSLNIPKAIEYIEMPTELRNQYQYFTEAPMQKLTEQGVVVPSTSLEVGVQNYLEKLKRESP